MQCLTDVYNKISDSDIELTDYRIPKNDAVTIKYMNAYGIFADYSKFEDLQSEFMALAHEYGHCKSRATHKLCSPYELIAQHESRANRTAVYEFLPCERIIEAISQGNIETWQIAEYLDMPEQFVKTAIEIYVSEERLLECRDTL